MGQISGCQVEETNPINADANTAVEAAAELKVSIQFSMERVDVDRPDSKWMLPVDIQVVNSVGDCVSFIAESDENGRINLTIPNQSAGTYKLGVRTFNSLRRVVEGISLGDSGAQNTLFLGDLYPGDFNQDGFITGVDFSILAGTMDVCDGDASYRDEADVDRNGCVDDDDVDVLYWSPENPNNRFGTAGDVLTECE